MPRGNMPRQPSQRGRQEEQPAKGVNGRDHAIIEAQESEDCGRACHRRSASRTLVKAMKAVVEEICIWIRPWPRAGPPDHRGP
jgi:hypothetical protein